MIDVEGFPTSDKIPRVAFVSMVAQGVRGPGQSTRRICIVGPKVSQPAAGGTVAVNTPTAIYSAEDAGAKFGFGSPVHRAAKAFLAEYPNAPLYGCAVAENAGAPAQAIATITVTGPATSSGSIRMYVGGDWADVAIASGDVAATVAAAMRAVIGVAGGTANDADWPVYASGAAADVILNAKFKGADGNDIKFACVQTGATGISLAGGTANLASGTLEHLWDAAYDALLDTDPTRYTGILPCTCDTAVLTTGVDAIKTRIGSIALPSGGGKRGFVVVGFTGTEADAETLSGALETGLAADASGPRIQLAHVKSHDIDPWVLAAHLAGLRFAREAERINMNWTGFTGHVIGGIHLPLSTANYPTRTEKNLALTGGVTEIDFDAVSGVAKVLRSITCKSSTGGVPDYRAIDTVIPVVCDYVTDDIETFLADQYDGFAVVDDVSGDIPDNLPAMTISPRVVKEAIYGRLKMHEAEGLITSVAAYYSAITVQRNPVTTSRLDCEVPIVVAPPLNQMAGNVREVGTGG